MQALEQVAVSRPAVARVVGVKRRNNTFDGDVELDLDLEVKVAGASPYRAFHRTRMPHSAARNLTSGTAVAVLVGPGWDLTVPHP